MLVIKKPSTPGCTVLSTPNLNRRVLLLGRFLYLFFCIPSFDRTWLQPTGNGNYRSRLEHAECLDPLNLIGFLIFTAHLFVLKHVHYV